MIQLSLPVTLVCVASLGAPLLAQSTQRASVNSLGRQTAAPCEFPAISASGRYAAFDSYSWNLVLGDVNDVADVFVRDLWTGTTELVSLNSSGQQADQLSMLPSLSADGRFVAFISYADNLVAGDTNQVFDAFVRDRQLGTTERVSVDSNGAQGNGPTYQAWISADGRYVLMYSAAFNLVSGDTNLAADAFVRDRQLGTTQRVSVDSSGAQGNAASFPLAFSADGRWAVFMSDATNLVPNDTNGQRDVFVHDLLSGVTERVSVSSTGAQSNAASGSWGATISADGRFVAFWSLATDLVPGITSAEQIYVRDRLLGTTSCVSTGPGGAAGNGVSRTPVLSADGRTVVFASDATNLGASDTNAHADIYARNWQTGATEIASVDSSGVQSNGQSIFPALSVDGRFVAFVSSANNLVAGDTNAVNDIFVRDRGSVPASQAFCFGDGHAGDCPCGNSGQAWRGCENSAGTGGARLEPAGAASLSNDTLQLVASGELPSANSLLLQGSMPIAPLSFGDGLRCTGGVLKRLYVQLAVSGEASFPAVGMQSLSVRSAALGDPIGTGSVRAYQVYYRDPDPNFCPAPSGSTYNISSGIAATWGP